MDGKSVITRKKNKTKFNAKANGVKNSKKSRISQ